MKQKQFVTGLVLAFCMSASLASAQSMDRWSTPPRYAIAKDAVTVTTSPTLVCAANDNRVNCTCRNLGPDTVRYGDSAITNSKGAQILSGEPAEIRIRGNVYMISEGGDTVVACTEEAY